MSSTNGIFNTRISRLMAERFSLEEIGQACFELGINYQEISGDTLSKKIRGLITHMDHRGRLQDLLTYLQEERPEQHWPIPTEDDVAAPPFKGLQFFTEKDDAIFFGREELTKELASHINEHRFLAVIGASGSGKSSVVFAGLVPALRRGEMVYQGQKSDQWPVHIITPGDKPLTELATTLTRDMESVTAAMTLLNDFRTSHQSLDLWLRREVSTKTRLLLLVDQFEELFTQCDDLEERRLFVENLVHAAQTGKPGRLSLVLTLRADFYAQALQYEVLVPLLEKRQRIVEMMKRNELRQAIEGPLENTPWEYQPGLVKTILQDLGAVEGHTPEPGALPLLSHVLLETWQRREGRTLTLVGYQDAGGVRRAIAQTADNVYEHLTSDEKIIARNIYLRLTELGEGTEDTRRRTQLTELIPKTDQAKAVHNVLIQLAHARLVTTYEDSAEVAHEALIREWPRLRKWLDENREWLRFLRQLSDDALEWIDNDKDPSFLYRGIRLAQITEWAEEKEIHLKGLELNFIAASIQEEERGFEEQEAQKNRELHLEKQRAEEAELRQDKHQQANKRLRILVSILVLVLIFAGSAAYFAFATQKKVEKQSDLAMAQSLAALSAVVINREADSELATLLAVEAARIDKRTEGNIDWLLGISLRSKTSEPIFYNDTLIGHEDSVRTIAFSPDGQWLASGSEDRTLRLWNPYNPSINAIILIDSDTSIFSISFSPNGNWLASGHGDGNVYLWDVDDLDATPTKLASDSSWISTLSFSPDGQLLASGGSDGIIHVWNLDDLNTNPILLTGHDSWVNSIAFSPDSQLLASGSEDRKIRLWAMDEINNSGYAPVELSRHEGAVRSVAFSPDRQWLASSGEDRSIRLYDLNKILTTGESLPYRETKSLAIAFSPDGQWLATGNSDNTVHLWDLRSLNAPIILTGHGAWIRSVAFSPDGQWLASAGDDKLIRLHLLLDPLIETGCQKVTRNLTWLEWQRLLPGDLYRPTCPALPCDPDVPLDQIDPNFGCP